MCRIAVPQKRVFYSTFSFQAFFAVKESLILDDWKMKRRWMVFGRSLLLRECTSSNVIRKYSAYGLRILMIHLAVWPKHFDHTTNAVGNNIHSIYMQNLKPTYILRANWLNLFRNYNICELPALWGWQVSKQRLLSKRGIEHKDIFWGKLFLSRGPTKLSNGGALNWMCGILSYCSSFQIFWKRVLPFVSTVDWSNRFIKL